MTMKSCVKNVRIGDIIEHHGMSVKVIEVKRSIFHTIGRIFNVSNIHRCVSNAKTCVVDPTNECIVKMTRVKVIDAGLTAPKKADFKQIQLISCVKGCASHYKGYVDRLMKGTTQHVSFIDLESIDANVKRIQNKAHAFTKQQLIAHMLMVNGPMTYKDINASIADIMDVPAENKQEKRSFKRKFSDLLTVIGFENGKPVYEVTRNGIILAAKVTAKLGIEGTKPNKSSQS